MSVTLNDEEFRLRELYKRHWAALDDALRATAGDRSFGGPLLISLKSGNYVGTTRKLVIVGQQTLGWGPTQGIDDPVEALMETYRRFALGVEYHPSPFWQAAHQVYRALNPGAPRNGFVWTNLVKLDQERDDGIGRPDPDIEEMLALHFNVLLDEMAIVAPEAVIFFTGPAYEDRLERTFRGVKRSEVSGFSRDSVVRLVHPGLPRHSYRTYHPNYLRRSRQWDLLTAIGNLVVGDPAPGTK